MEHPLLSGPVLLPQTGNPPQQLVVFLHGYGSNGDDLIDIGTYWADILPDTAFVSPHAPFPCEMNPMGYQWFGLQDFSPFNVRAGIDQARPILVKYLQELLKEYQLTPAQLALVGFSQGTMLALDMIFALPGLGTIIGYSGAFYPPIAEKTPLPHPDVLLIHGDADMMVPYAAFTEAKRQLSLFGIEARGHTCPGLGHGIDAIGMNLGAQFLKQSFTKTEPVIYTEKRM